MIIYKVIDLTNNKCYIGQTVQGLEKRKCRHINDSLTKKDNIYFHNALREHGIDNFKWEIIYKCSSKGELDLMETFKIIVNNSHYTKNGYNLTWGGDGRNGFVVNDETKQKISNSLKGRKLTDEQKINMSINRKKDWEKSDYRKYHTERVKNDKNPMFGKEGYWKTHKHNDETKQKISNSLKGRKLTDETKKKISESNIGRIVTNETKEKLRNANIGDKNPMFGKFGDKNPMFGKKHTNETKEKLKKIKCKKWLIIDLNNNEYLINNLKLFCLNNNLIYANILRHKNKLYKGYILKEVLY